MNEDQTVSHHFHQLMIAFRQLKDDPKSPKGQFHGRFRILKSLKKKGNVSQHELAELVAMKPGSLTEALERLEQEKLVVRQRDEKDRRIVRVALTKDGENEEIKMVNNFNHFEQHLYGVLTASEQSQLIRIIDKLTNQLQHMKEEQRNG